MASGHVNPADAGQGSGAPEGVERAASRRVFRPNVDIIDAPGAVYLVADVPGVDEAGAEVQLERNVLTIRGHVSPPQFPGYSPTFMEFEVGDFERAFTISSEIDRDRIEAAVKDGVLRVTLPKARHGGSHKIAVKAG